MKSSGRNSETLSGLYTWWQEVESNISDSLSDSAAVFGLQFPAGNTAPCNFDFIHLTIKHRFLKVVLKELYTKFRLFDFRKNKLCCVQN